MCMFCFFFGFLFKRDLKTYHLLLAGSVEELSFAKQEATKCNCYLAKKSSICLFDFFSFFSQILKFLVLIHLTAASGKHEYVFMTNVTNYLHGILTAWILWKDFSIP